MLAPALPAVLALAPFALQAQTPIPPKDDPLPEFTINFGEATASLPQNDPGGFLLKDTELTGDARLVWGDIRLRADRLIYHADTAEIEGIGNVVFTRGDETVRGTAITIFLQTSNFVVQNGVVVSPPVRIAGERIERVNGVLRAYRGKFTPDPNGNGEIQLLAREIRYTEDGDTDISDVRIYIYGQRILTIPHYRIRQQLGRQREALISVPIRFKVSRISGFAVGLENTWDLAQNLTGNVGVFFPTKNGPQYTVTANYDLLGTSHTPAPYLRRRQRDSLFNTLSAPPDTNPIPGNPSPLRRFLTIRPAPGPDPVLDFRPLISTTESVGEPLSEPPRFAVLSATFTGKEEIGVKRQGNLLLSRAPEANIEASFPLNSIGKGIEFETNAAARSYLHMPRFAAVANLSAGEYHEDRLSIANASTPSGALPPDGVDSSRVGGTVGVNLLPLLVGKNLLLRSQLSYSQYQYQRGFSYRVPELGVGVSYIFSSRTMLGGAIYQRQPTGNTPFYFDQIDTRSEAQAIAQTSLNNRVSVALLLRYDLDQSRLFDYGLTVAVRGRSLEPRFGYRKLGGQFSLGFGLLNF